jgi:nucleotide-binding universal stress UspA family protein
MYHSLLVPLDRSSFAEQALPWAFSIARRARARLGMVEVHAVYALEDPHAGWARFDSERDAQCKQQEWLFLDATAKRMNSLVPVSTTVSVLGGSAVLPCTVANALVKRAQANQNDLIVMATHGRGPVKRFLVGSVADELIRRATVPILLVRTSEARPQLFPEPVVEQVLLPLDGSSWADRALGSALDLACLMGARCTLLRVVEALGEDRARAEEAEARTYLKRIIGRLGEQAVPVEGLTVVAPGVA